MWGLQDTRVQGNKPMFPGNQTERQKHYSHDLTAALAACTKTTQDEASKHSNQE